MKFKTMIWNHQLDQTSSNSDLLDGVQRNALRQMACQDLMNFILSFAGLLKAAPCAARLHRWWTQEDADAGLEWRKRPAVCDGSFLPSLPSTVRRQTLSGVLFAM